MAKASPAAFNRLFRNRTAFETNAGTINSLIINKLRGVPAFYTVFLRFIEW